MNALPQWEHSADYRRRKVALAAQAIWKVNGGLPRLLREICRPGSELDKQQTLCWKQAEAVVAALEST